MTSALPTSTAPTTVALRVTGMKCAGCVSAVERRLYQQGGVQTAAVNLVAQLAVVTYDPDQTDAERMATALTASGFPSQPRTATDPLALWAQEEPPLQQQAGPLAIAALLLVLSFLGHLPTDWSWPVFQDLRLHALLATFALLGPGRPILINGFQGVRQGAPNMNSLVGLGAISAYAASLAAWGLPQLGWACFFEEPVMLLGFILLGRTLEAQARYRAGRSLRSLASLQPHQAHLLLPADAAAPTPADPQVDVGATTLKPGELLLVLPGERFPVDGEVVSGCSRVNEAMLSGEALPCYRQVGDLVSTGTVNLTAPLIVRATRTGLDTTLAQILQLVEEAQGRKAPIQRLADQVAGRFAWGVMTLALVTFLFWMLWGTRLWPAVLAQSVLGHVGHLPAHPIGSQTPLLFSLQRAIAVLVVACPCALGLATPTAILVASGIGAERGLLLRGGDVLERIAGLNDIVFDKTGTLTLGQPQLQQIEPQPGLTGRQLLRWAASLEMGTQHPLATAVVQAAQTQHIRLLAVGESQTAPGLGVRGVMEGQVFYLGQIRWLQEQGLILPEPEDGEDLITWLYLASADRYLGRLALTDTVRADAASVVAAFHQQGLRLHLLTGDRPSVAQQVARQVGIAVANVQASLSPAQKASTIGQLQQTGAQVGMVGDGINDAPALAVAEVGFAMGGGTDVAQASGDVILTGDRLEQILEAIQLSRDTLRTIRLNLAWAFAYNLLGIPLAAGLLLPWQGVALSPSLAGACMAVSSLAVVANSLSLYRRWPSPPASPPDSSGHPPAAAVADLRSDDGNSCRSSGGVPHS
jgi:P-type Cu2+ transporter